MNIELISRKPAGKTKSFPLLFVHGAYAGAWCWEKYFLPYFAQKGYAAYALSFRGHGNSDSGNMDCFYSLWDYQKDLNEAIAEIGSLPVLVGHSMGGLVIQNYLRSYRPKAAVLLASVPYTGLFSASMGMMISHPVLFNKLFLSNLLPDRLRNTVISPTDIRDLFFHETVAPETVAPYLSMFTRESYLALWELNCLNFVPRQWDSTVPVFVAGGADDIIIPLEMIHGTADAFKTKAKIYPEMGHVMMLDHNWQAVADDMLVWFDKIE